MGGNGENGRFTTEIAEKAEKYNGFWCVRLIIVVNRSIVPAVSRSGTDSCAGQRTPAQNREAALADGCSQVNTVRRSAIPLLWLALACLAHPPLVTAQEWPQFRGPDGQGHAVGRGLPIQWSESLNVRWKTPVPGRGWSSPVVAGGRVWLTTATVVNGQTSLRLLSFDADTGKPA